MTMLLRRHVLAATAAGTLAGAATARAQDASQGSSGPEGGPEPIKGNNGADTLAARNAPVAQEDPDILTSPRTDHGAVPNLKWPFALSHVLKGRACITAVNQRGHAFVDDVGEGDLWFFPSGVPHSIQDFHPDGTEFLLV